MLKTMRKNIKALGISLWLVIFAFIFFIFVDWGAGRLGPNPNPETVAWVKGEKILTRDFQRRLIDTRERIRAKYRDKAKAIINTPQFPQSILQQMVREKAIEIKARELGLKVFDDEVREKILSYPVFKDKNGNFVGVEEYARILSFYRLTVEQFENSVRKEILIEKFKNYVTSGVTITEEEAFEEYKKEKESISADLYIISKDKMTVEKQPTEKELVEFFNARKDEFRIPEKRTGYYAYFSIRDELKNVKVTDKDVRNYYDNNQEEFKESEKRFVKRIFVKKSTQNAKKIIEKALSELKSGAVFSEVAKKYSQDKYAKEGGDWGATEWIYSFSEDEKKKISEMKEDSISSIIETDDGYSIVYLSTVSPERILSFDEVKERILSMLKYKKAKETAYKKAVEFVKLSRKKGIKKAGKKKGISIKETKEMTLGEPIKPDDPMGIVSKTLFSLDKKKKVSDPTPSFSGFFVVELKKIIPERSAKFSEVKDKVKNAYISQEKEKLAMEKANSILSMIKNGETLPDFVEVKKEIKITHTEFIPSIGFVKGIFGKIEGLSEGEVGEPIIFSDGAMVAKVIKKELVNRNEFEKVKEEKIKSYIRTKKELFFNEYLSKLIENYGVKVNNYVFSSFMENAQ